MPGYQIHFSLNSSLDQPSLIEKLKTFAEVIQTSSGLCINSAYSESEIKKLLNESGFKNLNLVSVENTENDLTPDVQAFLTTTSK